MNPPKPREHDSHRAKPGAHSGVERFRQIALTSRRVPLDPLDGILASRFQGIRDGIYYGLYITYHMYVKYPIAEASVQVSQLAARVTESSNVAE